MNTTLNAERDIDFIRHAVRHAMDEMLRGRNPSTRRIAVLTVFGGADSYHVCYERACRLAHRYFAMSPESRTAILNSGSASQVRCVHLGRAVEELMQKNPHMDIPSAITHVYARGHAPRFYMGMSRALQLIRRFRIREKALMALAGKPV